MKLGHTFIILVIFAAIFGGLAALQADKARVANPLIVEEVALVELFHPATPIGTANNVVGGLCSGTRIRPADCLAMLDNRIQGVEAFCAIPYDAIVFTGEYSPQQHVIAHLLARLPEPFIVRTGEPSHEQLTTAARAFYDKACVRVPELHRIRARVAALLPPQS